MLLTNQALGIHKRSKMTAGWETAPHRVHPLLMKVYLMFVSPRNEGGCEHATPNTLLINA